MTQSAACCISCIMPHCFAVFVKIWKRLSRSCNRLPTSRNFFIYSIGGSCIFVLQSDAVFFNSDQPFFVQVADGPLEYFFTDTEEVGNGFGLAFIGDRDKPIPLLQFVHDSFGQGIDGFVAGFLQAKI